MTKEVPAIQHEILVKLSNFILSKGQIDEHEFILTTHLVSLMAAFSCPRFFFYIDEIELGIYKYDFYREIKISEGLSYEKNFIKSLFKQINNTGFLHIRHYTNNCYRVGFPELEKRVFELNVMSSLEDI
jgi:hypothetical protein